MSYVNRENDKSTIHIYDLDTGKVEDVIKFDYLVEAPNWSNDGKYLIFNSRGKIHKLNIETKEVSLIDTGIADKCNNDHVLSSDGKSIAVSHMTKEDGQSRIYICPFGEPENVKLITEKGWSFLHGWSPDMSTLCYCAKRGDRFNIFTIKADGSEDEVRLTDMPAQEDGPEYSPCGKYIWFNSDRNGLMQAFRMNADASEVTQMTFDENRNTWFPHISPDGKTVVLLSYKKGDLETYQHEPHKNVELRLMPSSGGEPKTVVTLFGGQGTINVNSWSPCSKKFSYVSYETE